jgi:carboxypeptidase C (cathepsin A)
MTTSPTTAFALLALLGCAPPSESRPAADAIKGLPNWDGPLPSKMYSGFVNSTHDATYGQMHSHYWFVEAEAAPESAPLLVWYNGGPGASSLFGLMIELGPFNFNDASLATAAAQKNGIPSPLRNPYSWSKAANVLAISAPPPVGFSYCDAGGPAGDGLSCGDWDDTKTAAANDASLRAWVRAFPAFAKSPMYIVGESYAGIYVPTLVQRILENNAKPKEFGPALALAGFGIGDGCIGHEDMPHVYRTVFDTQFMAGHGQFSAKLARQIDASCDWASAQAAASAAAAAAAAAAAREEEEEEEEEGEKEEEAAGWVHVGDTCAALLAQVDEEVGGYYAYNLYDECTYENVIAPAPPSAAAGGGLVAAGGAAAVRAAALPSSPSSPSSLSSPRERARPYDLDVAGGRVRARRPDELSRATARQRYGGALNDYVCGGPQVMKQYLNRSEVKAALNLPPDASFFQCDDGAGFNYTGNTPALMPFYRHVIENTSLRVLVYNGDTDPGLNSFYAQNWTSALGYAEAQPWRPWTLDGRQRMGGYVTRYEKDFDFLTIRGAGHMVPEYKSAASLEFVSRWLLGQDWQRYNATARR